MFTISDEEILDYTNQYRKDNDGRIIKHGNYNSDTLSIDDLLTRDEIIKRRIYYNDGIFNTISFSGYFIK